MIKNLILFVIILCSSAMSVGSTREEFPFFEKLGFASIGPCRTMEPDENFMRRQATNALLEIYGACNEKGKFPKLTLSTDGIQQQEERIVPDLWEVRKAPVANYDVMASFMVPRDGAQLSNCIESIRNCSHDKLVVDCMNVAEIAQISVMSIFFSDEQICYIQALYKKGKMQTLADLGIRNVVDAYLYTMPSRVGDAYDVEIGDFFYIPGHPYYSNIQPLGYSSGQNVYCVGFRNGKAMFIGFGNFFRGGPKTVEQIQQFLAEECMLGERDEHRYKQGVEIALDEIKNQQFSLRKLNIQKIKKALQL